MIHTFRVELFAGPRELMGQATLTVDVPCESSGSCTAQDVLAAIAEQHAALVPWIPSCRIAADDRYLSDQDPVSLESSVALIPPVSGG